ncbi:MAG TPA: ABC transporter substrate-binding protein [Chloroflexota bacterium]|nr:ABC transporter substrate-binding protein [Chloroflexota bacterium]
MPRTVRCVVLAALGLLLGCGAPATPAAQPPRAPSAPTAAAPAAQSAALAAAQPAAQPPGPLTPVSVGQVAAVLYPFYIGIDRGYFTEQGIEVQYDTFRSGAEMVPLIAQGQLDVSQQAVVPATFNAVLRGVSMKAILDASRGSPGQHSHATLVRKELWDSGAVRTLSDLVGRKVASSSLPGGLGIDVDRGLKREGHRLDELDQVQLPFPDMPAALANGSIDAAIAVEPSISTALNQDSAVVLRWLADDYPDHEIAVQVIGPSLIDRPELTRRLAVAYVRAARDWNAAAVQGVGVDDLARLLTPYNHLDAALNADLLRKRGLTSIDPDGRINKDALAYDMAWYLEGGHLERPIDLDAFVDSQYADYAVAQLGPAPAPRQQ